MPPQELTYGDWNTDTAASNNVDVQGDTFTLEARPTSVVSRPDDNNSFGTSGLRGLQIETNVQWGEIGGRISANTAGATRAYIYRISDGQLMGETDISDVAANETFTMTLTNALVSGETYNFVVDAEGASYTQGFYDSPSFPYTSSDGDLSIVAGGVQTTESDNNTSCLKEIGDVGF